MTGRNVEVATGPCFHCGEMGLVVVREDDFRKWQAGALIQVAFPEMKPDLREQLINGTHPECWDAMMGVGQ